MATNEILQFASTNTGTNLLTQAEYAADAQRTTGNQPGVARSKLVNKAMRQSSLLAAGLAEFIADYQANNVTDSLTPQDIADYLVAAIQANIPVVPDASDTVKGKIEIATAAEVQAFASSLLAVTPTTLNQSLKGSNQSLLDVGYQKLHGGLIMQWTTGTVLVASAVGSAGTVTMSLPIAFNTPLHGWCCQEKGAEPPGTEIGEFGFGLDTLTNTTATAKCIRNQGSNSGAETVRLTVLAFGY